MLTRSQRVTYDNLRLRDPGYMETVDRWYAESDHGSPTRVSVETSPMFHPFQIRDVVLPNRVVVSPMDQYTAVDGMQATGIWFISRAGRLGVQVLS